mmetsp:Transcript_9366/g.12283  ORF Transcript_9366/g.12283 Transcript_9366/m.12283 type:complete len:377 (-) Transcript_9366:1020-2150(-)
MYRVAFLNLSLALGNLLVRLQILVALTSLPLELRLRAPLSVRAFVHEHSSKSLAQQWTHKFLHLHRAFVVVRCCCFAVCCCCIRCCCSVEYCWDISQGLSFVFVGIRACLKRGRAVCLADACSPSWSRRYAVSTQCLDLAPHPLHYTQHWAHGFYRQVFEEARPSPQCARGCHCPWFRCEALGRPCGHSNGLVARYRVYLTRAWLLSTFQSQRVALVCLGVSPSPSSLLALLPLRPPPRYALPTSQTRHDSRLPPRLSDYHCSHCDPFYPADWMDDAAPCGSCHFGSLRRAGETHAAAPTHPTQRRAYDPFALFVLDGALFHSRLEVWALVGELGLFHSLQEEERSGGCGHSPSDQAHTSQLHRQLAVRPSLFASF